MATENSQFWLEGACYIHRLIIILINAHNASANQPQSGEGFFLWPFFYF